MVHARSFELIGGLAGSRRRRIALVGPVAPAIERSATYAEFPREPDGSCDALTGRRETVDRDSCRDDRHHT